MGSTGNSAAYPRRRRRPLRRLATRTTATTAAGGGIRVLHADDADGAWGGLAPSRERHGRLWLLTIAAGAGCRWDLACACAAPAAVEHHGCAERVEGRAWGWGRRPFWEPGGVALARGGRGGLLARGRGGGVGNVEVDIVRAADS